VQVAEHGPLTPLEIRERLERNEEHTSLYRACCVMRDQGLLSAHDDPRDGRAVLYAITDEGRAVLKLALRKEAV
jgi:DNA-binding PadR family transcriptional regulator